MKRLHLNKSLISSLIYLQLVVFVSIMVVPLISGEEFSSDVSQSLLVFVFLECILISLVDKAFNIYQIFLFMLFLFNLAQPIFELFGWYSYPPNNMIMYNAGVKQVISDRTLAETYKVLITMLLGTSFGWLIGIFKFNLYGKKKEYSISKTIVKNRNLFKYLFFILLPLTITFNTIRLYYSTIYGYIGVIHLKSVSDNIPFFLRVAEMVYPLAGYSMLFQSRNKKEYIRYGVLFLLPYFIQMFTGARGETIGVLLTVIFIYSYYLKQIKFKNIMPGGILLFILANAIGAYRYSRVIGNLLLDKSIFKFFIFNIASTASSMGVIAYTIELKDQFFNKIPFLLGYIQAIFSFAPNYTYEGIQKKNYLAQHLTYLLDPHRLYKGSTLGTAMGAEFYEISNGHMIVIFILSIVLLFCACYFIKKLFKNQFMFYVGAMYIQILCLSPRGSIMKIFNKESIIIIVILLFIGLLPRHRKHLYKVKSIDRFGKNFRCV